jgi:putative DNA primase/helicase
MKQWTGGDLIQARGLFSEQDKFRIVGKIFMSCNDLPPVSKQDGGTWRRIRVIPHTSIFKDHGDPLIDQSKHIYEKDPELEGKLRGWRTAFLSLLVHYWETHYLPYKVLDEPDCVLSASKKYKDESDLFMLFFNDNFIAASRDEVVSAKDVKTRFAEWLRSQGKTCDLKLGQVMERMKDVSAGGSTDKQFFGLRGLTDEEDISGAWAGTTNTTNTLILPV